MGNVPWSEEFPPTHWAVRVEEVALLMDGDVVVVPAQCREVGGVVAASVAVPDDVVGLEPIAGAASVDGAAAISERNSIPDRGRDPAGDC